jgi:hypothetical protein
MADRDPPRRATSSRSTQEANRLDVELSADEIAARLAVVEHPPRAHPTGVLAKYARLGGSAATGARVGLSMTRPDLVQRVLVPVGAGQHERIGVVRLLGFELVDIALFSADGWVLVADPGAVVGRSARRSTTHGLRSEDSSSRSARRSRRSRRTSATRPAEQRRREVLGGAGRRRTGIRGSPSCPE